MEAKKIIVTGMPHSGTSMLTEYLSKQYVGLPKKTEVAHGYDTYEPISMKSGGYTKERFNRAFSKDQYLWKTTELPHKLFEILKDTKPDVVYMSIRDPLYHGNSVAKRYSRERQRVAREFADTYPYLVRVALYVPTIVVQAEELAEHLETSRLSADATPSSALETLRADRNYHTLVELGRKRKWLTEITK